jgi:small subunit ribosomal protein S21
MGTVILKLRSGHRKGSEDQLAEVHLHEGETLESALRRFKRQVLQEDIIKEVKRHSFYLKPGERKRLKAALTRKRDRILRFWFTSVSRLSFAFLGVHNRYGGARRGLLRLRGHL